MPPLARRFSLSTAACTRTSWASWIQRGREAGFGGFHIRSSQSAFAGPAATASGRDRVAFPTATIDAPDAAQPENIVRGAWLAAASADCRGQAWSETAAALGDAEALGIRTVIVRPGVVPVPDGAMHHEAGLDDLRHGRLVADSVSRAIGESREYEEAAIDRACRAMFELCRRFPETNFAIAAGSTYYEIPQVHQLEWILSDVAIRNLGYWHEPSRCRRLEAFGCGLQSEWLERYADRLVGLTFEDASSTGDPTLPESGDVDLAMLGHYGGTRHAVTLRAEDRWSDDALRHAIDSLAKYGLNSRAVPS